LFLLLPSLKNELRQQGLTFGAFWLLFLGSRCSVDCGSMVLLVCHGNAIGGWGFFALPARSHWSAFRLRLLLLPVNAAIVAVSILANEPFGSADRWPLTYAAWWL
jgi:hypothetical protein